MTAQSPNRWTVREFPALTSSWTSWTPGVAPILSRPQLPAPQPSHSSSNGSQCHSVHTPCPWGPTSSHTPFASPLTSSDSADLRVDHMNSMTATKTAMMRPQMSTTKMPPMFSMPKPGGGGGEPGVGLRGPGVARGLWEGHSVQGWLTFSSMVLFLGAPAPLPPLALQDLQPVVLLKLQNGQCDLIPERGAWTGHTVGGRSSGPWSPAGPSPRCSLPSAAALLPPLQHPQHLPCPPSNLTAARHLPCNHPWAKPPLVTFVTGPLSLCPPHSLPARLFSTQQPEGQFQKHSQRSRLSGA